MLTFFLIHGGINEPQLCNPRKKLQQTRARKETALNKMVLETEP